MVNISRIEDTKTVFEKRNTSLKRIVDNRTLPGLLLLERDGNILSHNPFDQGLINKEHREWILEQFESNPPDKLVVNTVICCDDRSYGIRAFSLSNQYETEASFIIAILIEDISTDRTDILNASNLDSFHFSPRENDVIKALQLGLTDKMIASKLNISPETVHGYVKSIRAKLGVSTRTAILHKLSRH